MERIGDEVERELARGGRGGVAALAEIVSAWPSVVGVAVARQAWPLRLGRDGTLHVATSSATWAFELDRLSPEVLARLASVLGDATPAGLRFRPGPIPEPGAAVVSEPSDGTPDEPPDVPPEIALEAAAAAAAIADPELRALVARAARASLAQARSGRDI